MCVNAMSAMEARNLLNVAFYDCSGGTIGAIMCMMECECKEVQVVNAGVNDESECS